MATVGQKLYVNQDVDSVEYYEAPSISSRSYWAGYGAYLGEVTKEKVAGVSDNHTFMEVEKDGDKFYVIFNTKDFFLSDTEVTNTSTTSTGTTTTNTTKKSFLDKAIDLSKSLFDFLGKAKTTGVATTTSTNVEKNSLGTSDEGTTPDPEQSTNPVLEFLKKNWFWFLPSIILIPFLIYLAIKKLSKPKITTLNNPM